MLDICLMLIFNIVYIYIYIYQALYHWEIHCYQARQYMPTLLLTVDYWGEDSHACKVWISDCLVQDQTTNAGG